MDDNLQSNQKSFLGWTDGESVSFRLRSRRFGRPLLLLWETPAINKIQSSRWSRGCWLLLCFAASNISCRTKSSWSSCLRRRVPCAFRAEQTGSDSAGSISVQIVLSGSRSGGSKRAETHRELSESVVILTTKVKPGIQIMQNEDKDKANLVIRVWNTDRTQGDWIYARLLAKKTRQSGTGGREHRG